MATHIVSWGGNEHITSPVISSTKPSIVPIDSMLPHRRETSSEAPRAAGSYAKHMSPILIGSSGSETSASARTYSRADAGDGSFIRHHKYFFKDGNVTYLVDGTLYCVHRYFFSRDSVYFSTRFDQVDIRDHEALPITISLGNIERKDFNAFLSILYPENFEQHDLSYEEWKSVLHLSTRWDFASIRRLALNSIQPPTPHDRLLLARTYSVNDWVVPALSELCERRAPLTLDEAGQMNIEDVVLVATVREDIRSHALQVDAAEIPRHVDAAQARKLVPPAVPTSGVVEHGSSLTGQKRASNSYEGDDEAMEKQKTSGEIGEDKHSQVQTASATAAAPSAGQVVGHEAMNQPADVITNKRPTHDAVEATQATDKAAPDASGVKSTSVSNGVNTVLTQETTSTKAVPEPELGEDHAPRPPPTDASTPPPVPEKDTSITNKTEEPSAQPTEPEAPATENADGSKLDAVEEGSKPQFGVGGDNRAVYEGSVTQDGAGKADGATKLMLRMDRVRELSTASIMTASSSTSRTSTEEAASSAVDEGEGGAPEQAGTSSKNTRREEKKLRKKEKTKLRREEKMKLRREEEKLRREEENKLMNKSEKNSPRPPSGETVHNADNWTIEDHNPPVVATTAPVDIPSGKEDAPVMVYKVDSSGEDPAVKVEWPQIEARKTADGDGGTDEWSWGDVPELEAPEDDDPADETGVNPKDIELVMSQVNCSRAKAVRALKENSGDVIDAIMAACE